jgi:hypothetical protein
MLIKFSMIATLVGLAYAVGWIQPLFDFDSTDNEKV